MSPQLEAERLEHALRLVLRLFANGDLVYRRREDRVALDVAARAERVRRVRGEGEVARARVA